MQLRAFFRFGGRTCRRVSNSAKTHSAGPPLAGDAKGGLHLKVSRDFMLREIAGESLLVPVNEAAVNFQGIMSLNESGRLLWDRLQKDTTEDDLVSALLDVYDTTPEVARQDVAVFLDQLRERDILQEA